MNNEICIYYFDMLAMDGTTRNHAPSYPHSVNMQKQLNASTLVVWRLRIWPQASSLGYTS